MVEIVDESRELRNLSESHLQISGTYLYSSCERMRAELLDDPLIANDSLSRLFELASVDKQS